MAMTKPLVAIRISLFLSLVVFSSFADAQDDIVQLPQVEFALQDLLGAWNKTPNLNSSLPGWVPFDPTDQTIEDPCIFGSWRGVFCSIEYNKTVKNKAASTQYWDANVVAIRVSDASIVGTLPSSVWNFNNMVYLTLTENPGLNGSIPLLPENLTFLNLGILKSLDLHGNAFSGNLSDLFDFYYFIEDLDLSNNYLEGLLPNSLGYYGTLRTLRVSNNTFAGNISEDITQNWKKIIIADFSCNKFVGNIPNFSNSPYLYNLNISHNNFDGVIKLVTILNPQTNESLAMLDLSDNNFTGPMPDVGNLTMLQSLNLSSNKFDAEPFPSQRLRSLEKLQTLSLSNTSLNGELNLSLFCNFSSLKIIELDNNNFTGALDMESYRCTNRSSLIVQLKHNQIDKVIFNAPSVLNLNIMIDLTGNPYCDSKKTDIRRCLCEQQCIDTKTNSRSIIIGFIIGGSLGGVVIIIASILLWKSRKERRHLLLAVHQKFAEYEMKPTLFSYSELEKATKNFHPNMKVGEGAFGAVYKGMLTDGSEVAVKQLFTKAQQNMDDFLNEVVLLTSVKHRNLVKLKGCCLRGDKRLLVYEYLDNYDLANTLFDHKGNQLVTWPTRFNICLGVAHGLHYLHEGVDQRILHRDVKASNVLLDQNLLPKIADFGLALLFPNVESHVTVEQVAGTMGYLALEYATRHQLSDKIDVFSFGVLALEVVSGRRNIDFNAPPNKTYLIEWAWKLNEEGRLMDFVDPILSIQIDEEVVVQRVITIALSCLQTAPGRRPTMAQVVRMLQGDIEISESIKGQVDEEINQIYRSLLGLDNTTTTLLTKNEENPTFVLKDEENQALFWGEGSSSRTFLPEAIELSTIKSR